MSFSSDELARYQRHLALPGFGPDAQVALKHARVLVIGAGGLGCPALLYLTAAGIGHITISDGDTVDVSNLQRQVLFTTNDAVARTPKALAAARRLRDLNPHVEIDALAENFSHTNALTLVTAHDVIVDASDNFTARYLVNDACVIANKPFVHGAIHGFEGQVSVFNWRGGPTYCCLFPNPAAAGAVRNCAEAGVLGVLPGIVGTAQAAETIKLITGIGEPLSGKLWIFNALTMDTRTLKISRNPQTATRTTELQETKKFMNAETSKGTLNDEIGADELRDLMKNGGVQLLDVRESWEREMSAINPSAHVPLGDLGKSEADVALKAGGLVPSARTVVYCAGGVRSLKALALLRERNGFACVQSLRGGMRAW